MAVYVRRHTRRRREVKPGIARIRAAQREYEQFVLQKIKKDGVYQRNIGATSRTITNAIERLEAKGKIRYSRAKFGYVVK